MGILGKIFGGGKDDDDKKKKRPSGRRGGLPSNISGRQKKKGGLPSVSGPGTPEPEAPEEIEDAEEATEEDEVLPASAAAPDDMDIDLSGIDDVDDDTVDAPAPEAESPAADAKDVDAAGREKHGKPSSSSTAIIPPKGAPSGDSPDGASAPGVRPPPRPSGGSSRRRVSTVRKRIGQLLVKGNNITEAQLERALGKQESEGGLLGQILVGMGACNKAMVGAALNKQSTVTSVDLSSVEFDPEALALLSREYCMEHRVIPFEKMGNMICVAMSNVLDRDTRGEIHDTTQLKVKVFDSPWAEVYDAIEARYAELENAEEEGAEAETATADADAEATTVDLDEEDEVLDIDLSDEDIAVVEEADESPVDAAEDGVAEAEEPAEADAASDIEAALRKKAASKPPPKEEPKPQPKAKPKPEASSEASAKKTKAAAGPSISKPKPAETPKAAKPAGPTISGGASGPSLSKPSPEAALEPLPVDDAYFDAVVRNGIHSTERRWTADRSADAALPADPARD